MILMKYPNSRGISYVYDKAKDILILEGTIRSMVFSDATCLFVRPIRTGGLEDWRLDDFQPFVVDVSARARLTEQARGFRPSLCTSASRPEFLIEAANHTYQPLAMMLHDS